MSYKHSFETKIDYLEFPHPSKKIIISLVCEWGWEDEHYSISKRYKKILRKCLANKTTVKLLGVTHGEFSHKVEGIKIIPRRVLKRRIREARKWLASQKKLGR